MRIRLLTCALVLLLLAGTGLAACATTAASPGATTVTVTLTDTSVIASPATFAPGARCHFVVTNQGRQPHQFWLVPRTMQQMMRGMPMAQWRQQVLYSSQTIAVSQTVVFDYTFPMMSAHQELAFGCFTDNRQPVYMMPIRLSGS